MARAVPRAEGGAKRAVIPREAIKAVAMTAFETLAMTRALPWCTWTSEFDSTIWTAESVITRACASFGALALTAAVLRTSQRLHAVVACEASFASAELSQGTSSMIATLGWARVRCVKNGDIIVALRC